VGGKKERKRKKRERGRLEKKKGKVDTDNLLYFFSSAEVRSKCPAIQEKGERGGEKTLFQEKRKEETWCRPKSLQLFRRLFQSERKKKRGEGKHRKEGKKKRRKCVPLSSTALGPIPPFFAGEGEGNHVGEKKGGRTW